MEEEGYVLLLLQTPSLTSLRWGELCPMRFSSSVDHFYLLPQASRSYTAYSAALLHIARTHSASLFIPVSGVASSVEDARAAVDMYAQTEQRCRTIIQDPETMLDLHDKDRFINLASRLGLLAPKGKKVTRVDAAMDYLAGHVGLKEIEGGRRKFVLKCMGIDENRGDMTLFPLDGDGKNMSWTRRRLDALSLAISKECPYVLQEFISGQGESSSCFTFTYNELTLQYRILYPRIRPSRSPHILCLLPVKRYAHDLRVCHPVFSRGTCRTVDSGIPFTSAGR